MNIYDVQNAQYALSVLDDLEHKINPLYDSKRTPIFLFNNHYISGEFILNKENQKEFYGHSELKESDTDSKIINYGYEENDVKHFQIAETRHLVFNKLDKNDFGSNYRLPNSSMEISFIQNVIHSINLEHTPQNDLLIGKNINFMDLGLNFDTYQFTEKDGFELVSIKKEKLS